MAWSPQVFFLEIACDLHHMAANQILGNGQNVFGQEADLTLTYKQDKNRYIWGRSAYLPGPLSLS